VDFTGLVEKKNRSGTRYFEDEDGGITAKECKGCCEVKVMGDFSKNKRGLGSRQSKCKACQRKYCEENRASIAEKARKYYEENRSSIAEYHRKYREENSGYILERDHKYQEENRVTILERKRKYSKENSDYISERDRKYYEENRVSILERKRKYDKENPHVGSAARHRRRARKSLLPDTLTKEQLGEITDRFHGGCALTGCTDGTHLDHAVPVVIGHGGTTAQNMIPLRADLNISKSARCIFDWFYDVKDHFNLPQTKFDELIEYLADINGMTANEYEDYVRGCHDNPRVIDETILDETGSAG